MTEILQVDDSKYKKVKIIAIAQTIGFIVLIMISGLSVSIVVEPGYEETGLELLIGITFILLTMIFVLIDRKSKGKPIKINIYGIDKYKLNYYNRVLHVESLDDKEEYDVNSIIRFDISKRDGFEYIDITFLASSVLKTNIEQKRIEILNIYTDESVEELCKIIKDIYYIDVVKK